MKKQIVRVTSVISLLTLMFWVSHAVANPSQELDKTRVIITSDGEIDDECSLVRCLLYANEWDIEAIVTSSSQYHWHGHNWAGDDWIDPYLLAYAEVYPNLIKHDPAYPTPEYLKTRTALGNVELEGEMEKVTDGSQLIVKVLLDDSDSRPIWLQAWGGMNTIARALKTIEEEHPERMAEVAEKIRFFFIWEQDATYQEYIRPHWGKYNIMTVISDQFEAIAYRWKTIQPIEMQAFYNGEWMSENILEEHGPLCSLYRSHVENEDGFDIGDFRSEGDSPAFVHTISTGLRNLENPDWGGWGGRYVRVLENTWLDPKTDPDYVYPEGRYYTKNAWGRNSTRRGNTSFNNEMHREYFRPIWRWSEAFQNDFAARADWCVKSLAESNHPPVVKLAGPLNLKVKSGSVVELNAEGTVDPDGDDLSFSWWQYSEAGSYDGIVEINHADQFAASLVVPSEAAGKVFHIVCEVTDSGSPKLTRYQRLIVEVEAD